MNRLSKQTKLLAVLLRLIRRPVIQLVHLRKMLLASLHTQQAPHSALYRGVSQMNDATLRRSVATFSALETHHLARRVSPIADGGGPPRQIGHGFPG